MDRKQWNDEGQGLKEELIAYDWNYRLKICTKCPLSEQIRRKCFKVNRFKIIKGKKIQETHCKWMSKARTQKFKSKIMSFLNLGMRSMYGVK